MLYFYFLLNIQNVKAVDCYSCGGGGAQSCPTFCDHVDHTPLSMGSPRQEYWSVLPFPTPEDLPNPNIELASLMSLAWQVDSLPLWTIIKKFKKHCVGQTKHINKPKLIFMVLV